MGRVWKPTAVVAAGMALAFIGGCGGDPDEQDALETAGEALPLYIAYDPGFCELLTEDEQQLVAIRAASMGASGDGCEDAIEQQNERAGGPPEGGLFLPDEFRAAAENVEDAEVVMGDGVAIVRLMTPEGDYAGEVELAAEDGEWRVVDIVT